MHTKSHWYHATQLPQRYLESAIHRRGLYILFSATPSGINSAIDKRLGIIRPSGLSTSRVELRSHARRTLFCRLYTRGLLYAARCVVISRFAHRWFSKTASGVYIYHSTRPNRFSSCSADSQAKSKLPPSFNHGCRVYIYIDVHAIRDLLRRTSKSSKRGWCIESFRGVGARFRVIGHF